MRLSDAVALLACPRCQGALVGGLRCERCAQSYAVEAGVPELRLPADARTEAVRSFYSVAPFPGYPPRDSHGWLRARAARSEIARLLDQAIPGDARVVELGCGTGQMALFLASADRLVIGADLTRASLELAEAARRRYGVERALFVETDLRAPGLREGAFDVVYSSGVLHHTPEPRSSFAAMARLARAGGIVVVGLYNAYARIPHRLRRGIARFTRGRLVPFDPVLRDRRTEPERRDAWLRDQYFHVEEHRHTLREVQKWFGENGVEYLRAFPDTLLAAEPLAGDALFSAAEDDWALENVLAQLAWMWTLGREGGLFLAIGRSRGAVPVSRESAAR
jgi:SAM-dependent methyltransferase